MSDGLDGIVCLYCARIAAVTVTAELAGVLAHYPTCEAHAARGAAQMVAERGRVRAGLDPFTGLRAVNAGTPEA